MPHDQPEQCWAIADDADREQRLKDIIAFTEAAAQIQTKIALCRSYGNAMVEHRECNGISQ
jgi:hypothetical protein